MDANIGKFVCAIFLSLIIAPMTPLIYMSYMAYLYVKNEVEKNRNVLIGPLALNAFTTGGMGMAFSSNLVYLQS